MRTGTRDRFERTLARRVREAVEAATTSIRANEPERRRHIEVLLANKEDGLIVQTLLNRERDVAELQAAVNTLRTICFELRGDLESVQEKADYYRRLTETLGRDTA